MLLLFGGESESKADMHAPDGGVLTDLWSSSGRTYCVRRLAVAAAADDMCVHATDTDYACTAENGDARDSSSHSSAEISREQLWFDRVFASR